MELTRNTDETGKPMNDLTMDQLILHYERAHKMGASAPDRRTIALQTKELLEELVELRKKLAAAERKLEVVKDKVWWLKTGMTANIPLGPPNPEYDPHDEFKRCAVDRAERVNEFARNLERDFKEIDTEAAAE